MALDKFQPYLFVSAGEQSNKYLTPVISPDGIASFQAQRAQDLTDLTIRIEPIQSGTGDPSPDNIRPISGRTGLTVTRAGENLFVPLNARNTTAKGVNVVSDGNGTITMNGTATGNDYVSLLFPSSFIIPDGAIFKFCLLNTQASSESIFRFVNGSTIVDSWAPNVVNREMNYSGMSGKEVTGVRIYITNGTTYSMTMQPMFVPKTVSVNGYIPYAATAYPITWESIAGTVYGGTLDVVSGVLTVDRGFAELSEDWAWRKSSAYPGGYIVNRDVVPGTAKLSTPFVCSHAKTVTRTADYVFGTCYCDSSMNFRIMGESSTLQDWKDYIAAQRTAGTPVQICYYLAAPQTYQLTPTEVRTIAGYNQVYSDAGPVIDIKF